MRMAINNLLDKLSKENKTFFHLGDFSIDVLNYDQHSLTNEFLDPPLFSYAPASYYTTNKNKK